MRKAIHKAEPIILLALFAIYHIVLFKITLFRNSSSGARNVNFIPFITIAEYFRTVASRGIGVTGIANLLGNLILFFPLGYISAALLPKMRKLTRILILTFAISVLIEVLQYVFACGSTDVDDVILNTLGGVIGYWVYSLTSKVFKPKKFAIFISASMIVATCIGFYSFDNYRFLVDRPGRGERPALSETLDESLGEPLVIDEQTNAHLFVSELNNTDFNAGSTADVQNNTDEAAWYLILVNKWNCLPDDYKVELIEFADGSSVDKRMHTALQEMFDSARSNGVYPVVVSGYRTEKEQQSLLDEKIAAYKAEGYSAEDAITKAEAWVAVPGTSEHQLGIAVDINADGINSTGQEVYDWLDQNSYKFGFIRRYPPDKTGITGVINEPWHYRYVGVDAATDMYDRGICLEEYLGKINVPTAEIRQRSRSTTEDAAQEIAPGNGEVDQNRRLNQRGNLSPP